MSLNAKRRASEQYVVHPRARSHLLEGAGIVVNSNSIPHDPSSPFYPSGIRIGKPAVTTRGMRETEMERIANIIAEAFEVL